MSLSTETTSNFDLKAFEEKLQRYFIFRKKTPKIAQDLFNDIPEDLDLEIIVDMIFKKSCDDHAKLLKALHYTYPSLSLSPYSEIRKAIIDDKKHKLTNDSLLEMLKKYDLDQDEEKISECCDIAYNYRHPNIYLASKVSILPSEYNLNFLWINLNPQNRITDNSENIFNDGLNQFENDALLSNPIKLRETENNKKSLSEADLKRWKEIKKTFMYKLSKWIDLNSNTEINLWYDSALVTKKAQIVTSKILKKIGKSRNASNIHLKDIRKLSIVEGEIKNLLHPGTNLYYRIDLVKALISDHMLTSPEISAKYCVVSDIDVVPMNSQELFDDRTLNFLNNKGYILNLPYIHHYENSFMIFNRENEDVIKNQREMVIDASVTLVKELRSYPINTHFDDSGILGPQSIYRNYYDFLLTMGERSLIPGPRKIAKCPRTQFDLGGSFEESDYRKETFRFIGESDMPYAFFGRAYQKNPYRQKESQIQELIHWKAEPL